MTLGILLVGSNTLIWFSLEIPGILVGSVIGTDLLRLVWIIANIV